MRHTRLLAVLLLLMPTMVFAQHTPNETLTIQGVPIKGTIHEVASGLYQKGWKNEGIYDDESIYLIGKFLGEDAEIMLNPISDNDSRIATAFVMIESDALYMTDFITNDFMKIVRRYEKKYGEAKIETYDCYDESDKNATKYNFNADELLMQAKFNLFIYANAFVGPLKDFTVNITYFSVENIIDMYEAFKKSEQNKNDEI